MKKLLGILLNGSLAIAAVAIVFILLEILLSRFQASSGDDESTENVPLYITSEKPYLYRMNPKHTRVNSFGLRDNEFSQEKPAGVFRILVLGDSIAYGRVVRSAMTFPNQLEQLLREQGKKVEVINAGISGYSPYNELHYYLEEGRQFDPDLVIVAFCMNDVANPRLHWGYTQEKITHIPDAAIPNLRYDREVIQPLLQARNTSLQRKWDGTQSLLSAAVKQTRSYQFIASLWQRAFPDTGQQQLQKHLPVVDKGIPTYITGEDNISIEVLTHEQSEEWQWLTAQYRQIHAATRADKIPMLLAIFPLAYQLDPAYPHFPQKLFASFCRTEQLDCVDFLDSFRQQGKEKIFMLDKERGYDVWHLTLEGHGATAKVLYDRINALHYIP